MENNSMLSFRPAASFIGSTNIAGWMNGAIQQPAYLTPVVAGALIRRVRNVNGAHHVLNGGQERLAHEERQTLNRNMLHRSMQNIMTSRQESGVFLSVETYQNWYMGQQVEYWNLHLIETLKVVTRDELASLTVQHHSPETYLLNLCYIALCNQHLGLNEVDEENTSHVRACCRLEAESWMEERYRQWIDYHLQEQSIVLANNARVKFQQQTQFGLQYNGTNMATWANSGTMRNSSQPNGQMVNLGNMQQTPPVNGLQPPTVRDTSSNRVKSRTRRDARNGHPPQSRNSEQRNRNESVARAPSERPQQQHLDRTRRSAVRDNRRVPDGAQDTSTTLPVLNQASPEDVLLSLPPSQMPSSPLQRQVNGVQTPIPDDLDFLFQLEQDVPPPLLPRDEQAQVDRAVNADNGIGGFTNEQDDLFGDFDNDPNDIFNFVNDADFFGGRDAEA